MRVLTICAHHNPRSFCHAVLERFTEGLRDAGHTARCIALTRRVARKLREMVATAGAGQAPPRPRHARPQADGPGAE